MKKYTLDILERSKTIETDRVIRFEIDNHIIALAAIHSYDGGMSNSLYMLVIDGKTKCSRTTYINGLKKAIEILNK